MITKRQCSIATLLLLGLYLQLIEWVPLFPFNDLSHGNGQERLDLVLGGVYAFFVLAAVRRWQAWMVMSIIANAGWLWLQIDSWWRPYLMGATNREHLMYERWFGATYKFLPANGPNPIPDAAHVILQLFIAAALVSTLLAVAEIRAERQLRAKQGGLHAGAVIAAMLFPGMRSETPPLRPTSCVESLIAASPPRNSV